MPVPRKPRSELGKALDQAYEQSDYDRWLDVAEELGVGISTIEQWKAAKPLRDPPLRKALRLAQMLGMTSDELVSAALEDARPPARRSTGSNGARPVPAAPEQPRRGRAEAEARVEDRDQRRGQQAQPRDTQ